MSLRLRLVLLILLLMALATVAISAVQLQTLVDSLSTQTIGRAEDAAKQVSAFLIDHIRTSTGAMELPAPLTVAETKTLWRDIASSDPAVSDFLERTMALSSYSLIEINVADANGYILTSSNPANVGDRLKHREAFTEWSRLPLWERARDLVTRRPDWEWIAPPIGIAGPDDPVFTIQVITSSVLVRDAIWPQLERLLEVSGGAVAVSLLLIVVTTHRILRPLQRIEQTIDRIAQGSFQAEESDGPVAKEFRVVQSKLNLLGQQFHGERADASVLRKNIDVLVERMASELDVATRLAAISRLTGGVAHEIKNPLNAILLRLELLRERLGSTDAQSTQELAILSKEVLRLDRVVKTFLDFSRPVEVNLRDVDLGRVVQEVADLITAQAALAKIKVTCRVPDQPAPIRGDVDLLKQALLNLVTNAVEAMNEGGELTMLLEPAGDKVVVTVGDTGPGIPEELQGKVFQLYFTTKKQGSGIGLAMTYRAIQLHNGTISFSTENGQGTTFRLEFPSSVQHA